MSEPRRCPQCDAEIPVNSPAGLCPRCLLKASTDSQSAAFVDPGPTKLTPPASGFVPPTVEELTPLFPQLEILELLGKGGMGAVYKARQPGLDRLVAVKILPPEISRDPAFTERFQREARALARLSHPHIVAVYDFGETAGLCYIVMEFVDGANLRQVLARSDRIHAVDQSPNAARDPMNRVTTSALTSAEALAIVPQICEALQFAHDEGVVHRDIKPENILIDKRGRVKIADFGLAKLLGQDASDHSLTATHQVMGTLRYMAPEQMQGSSEVDHRADIYSLGVVFYELLTGELPMGRFAPPSKRVQVDVRLDEIVLRALEQQPEQRYQHASELKSAVTSFSAIADRAPMTPDDQHRDQSRRLTTQVHKLLDVTETRNRRLHHLVAAIGLVSLLMTFPMGLASLAKTLTGYRSILLCAGAMAALAGIGLLAYSSRIKRRLCWKVNFKGHTIVFDGGRAFAERLYLDDGLVRQGGFGGKMEIRSTIKAGDGIGDEIVVWYDAHILSCRCRIEVEEKSLWEQPVPAPVSAPIEQRDPPEPFREVAQSATVPNPSYAKQVGIPVAVLFGLGAVAMMNFAPVFGQKDNFQQQPAMFVLMSWANLFWVTTIILHILFFARRRASLESATSPSDDSGRVIRPSYGSRVGIPMAILFGLFGMATNTAQWFYGINENNYPGHPKIMIIASGALLFWLSVIILNVVFFARRAVTMQAAPMPSDSLSLGVTPLPKLVPVLATFNLVGAVVLMLVCAMEEPAEFAKPMPRLWQLWEQVDAVLGFTMAAGMFAASIGLFLWEPWARKLTLGVCIYGLASVVFDAPYLARFVLPDLYADIQQTVIAEGVDPDAQDFVTLFTIVVLFGGMMVVGLTWLIGQLVYFTRPRVVAAFESQGEKHGKFIEWLFTGVGAVVGVLSVFGPLALLLGVTAMFNGSSGVQTVSQDFTALPPLGTITNGIGVEFTVPAGQVATFEIVTRRDNETVLVPPHCAYLLASAEKPITGQFRWSRILEEAVAGSHSRWRIEMRSAGGGGGHSEGTLLPDELNAAVGARGLALGLLEPNEESIHWGTADVKNLPANGLIGLRVTVLAHGLNGVSSGSGTAHIDWKKSLTTESTSRRKLPEVAP